MSDGYIQLPPDSTGKKADTEELTVGANTVQRERTQIAGAAAGAIAPVDATAGLKVDLGADNDVDVIDRAARDLGKVDIAAIDVALPAGDNNIGNVDVASLPALPAGTNNIGDVDVATLPALPTGTAKIGVVAKDITGPSNGATALTPKFIKVDCASSGDNEIVAAVVGKKIRVLAVVLVASGGANTLTWKDGSTAVSGGMGFAANGGYSIMCEFGLWEGTANTALNLNLSAATSVDGHITYVEV